MGLGHAHSDRVIFRIRSAADSWISGVFKSTARPRAKLLGTIRTVCQPGNASVLARPWHRLRKEIGLPPVRGFNPLTESHSPVMHLALFSKWLADKQRDWPAQTIVTGFPWFDADGDAGLPQKFARFLDDGEPPLVFTLGTAVVADAGPFYHHSAAAAKLMGRRRSFSSRTHEFFYRSYRRASSLLTTLPSHFYSPARLRSSITVGSVLPDRPCVRGVLLWLCHVPGTSLTTPNEQHGWASLERSPETAMTHSRVSAELRLLLEDPAYSQRASEIATKVRQEEGVKAACDALESL